MSDFWSRALGGGDPAVAASVSPGPPVPQAAPYRPPVSPVNHKARSSLSTARCPDCGSGNYSSGDSLHMTRCYDCGYNPRFGTQAGASGVPAGQGGPATPARQVSTSNNYQPGVLIGHVE